MARPLILDGRNLLQGEEMIALGFEYLGIGKATEDVATYCREVRKAPCEPADELREYEKRPCSRGTIPS